MNDEQLFIMYANYPVIDNRGEYYNFLKSYSVNTLWGKISQTEGRITRRLNLDSEEIEEQRNLLFQEVLTKITEGAPSVEIDGLDKILQEANRNKAIVTFKLTLDEKGNEKFTRSEEISYFKRKTQSEYLYNLACHSLMSFLSVKDNRRKIKQCPYCKKFFTAKNNKRTYCYEKRCNTIYEKKRKRKWRHSESKKTCNPVP